MAFGSLLRPRPLRCGTLAALPLLWQHEFLLALSVHHGARRSPLRCDRLVLRPLLRGAGEVLLRVRLRSPLSFIYHRSDVLVDFGMAFLTQALVSHYSVAWCTGELYSAKYLVSRSMRFHGL